MDYQFMIVLKDYTDKGLDDPELNQEWVAQARDFLKLAEDMDEQEREAADNELVEKFKEKHIEELIESEELKNVKNDIEEVKRKQAEIERQQHLKDLRIGAREDLRSKDLTFLEKQKEKYSELPEIIEQFDLRIADLKKPPPPVPRKLPDPPPPEEPLKDKLKKFHGREITYDQLKSLGIKVTGDDMVIEGIKLYRRYLFLVYTVDASS